MKRYKPDEFWNGEAGKVVMFGLKTQDHQQQYDMLIPYLENLKFDSILEIGAGDGRITDYIQDNFRVKEHICIDLSNDRKLMFEKNLPYFDSKNYHVGDFVEMDLPQEDLVITSDTLVHVRPERIKKFIEKMIKQAKKHVLFIEYTPKISSTLMYYCFEHDYQKIIIDLGYDFISKRVNEKYKLYHIDLH